MSAVLQTPPVVAQEPLPDFYKEPGLHPHRDYVNQHWTEHIDPFTGSLQLHATDLFIPGDGGLDLKIVRSYNSNNVDPVNPAAAGTATMAGLGWNIHFGRVLKRGNLAICQNTDSAQVADNPVLELPDGTRQVFAFPTPGAGAPLMITAQRWKAECLGGTSLMVYSPDGMRYEMTRAFQEVGTPFVVNAWYATRIWDRNDNWIAISYGAGAFAEITGVTTSDGRSVSFTYDDAGLLSRRVRTITANGQQWTYEYLPIGGSAANVYRLTRVIRPDVGLTNWQFAYNGFVGNDNANNYQLQRVTFPQGGAITYGYRFVVFDPTVNPSVRSVVVETKATTDGTWSFAYAPGNSTTPDQTTVTLPGSIGQIVNRHKGPNLLGTGSVADVWKNGLLLQKIVGSVQTETYDWSFQVLSPEQNKRNGTFARYGDPNYRAPVLTSRTIVRNGQTYQTTYSTFDGYGNPQSVTESGPNGGNRTTNLSYYLDTVLWIVKQVDDETTLGVGSVTRTWDLKGRIASETRDGIATTYAHYANGNLERVVRPRGLTTTYSDYFRGVSRLEQQPENVTIRRIVNSTGTVASETNGRGKTTGYLYDGLTRVTQITPPRGALTTFNYQAASQRATRSDLIKDTVFDGYGRPTSVTLGGITTTFRYDALGRKTFESVPGYTTGTNYLYDILDRVTTITNADGSNKLHTYGAATMSVRDERLKTTTFGYRAYGDPDKAFVMSVSAPVAAASMAIQRNGRDLVTEIRQGSPQVARSFTYYTNQGYYLQTATHPETGVTTYGRDDAGNMTSKAVGTSPATLLEYDLRNRLFRVTYPNGDPNQVVNTYSETDRLRTITSGGTWGIVRTLDYDDNDNLTVESLTTFGVTMTAGYGYNAKDHLESITYPVRNTLVQLQPDVLGRPRNAIASPCCGNLLGANYWPTGQLYDVAFVGNSRVTYGMNVRMWPSTVAMSVGGVTQSNATLFWDQAGNLTGITDSADAQFNRTFRYDDINRLTGADGPWGTGSLSYSGTGNLDTYNLGASTQSYVYDGTHRLTSVSGRTNLTFGYDVYGNASTINGRVNANRYDHASNLRDVDLGTGRYDNYYYDGTNARAYAYENGAATYEFRSVNGGALLAEWTQFWWGLNRLKEHIHIGGKRVAEQSTYWDAAGTQPTTVMFLLPDTLGSPQMATWAGGTVLWKEAYRPYGDQLINSAAANDINSMFYAGKQYSSFSGLSYMGGRYYRPAIGRFTGIDPREVDADNLHSFNRYAYAANSPYRYVDPDGNTPLDIAFLAYDIGKLGVAIYTGVGVPGALADVGASVLGVFSPVPGGRFALQALKYSERGAEMSYTLVRGAEAAGSVAKAAETAAAKAGAAKSAEQMAGELRQQIGRNSVEFTTSSTKGHIDLAGKAHFDKATQTSIPTPHVQTRSKHAGPDGKINLGAESTRPATKQDIRTARELGKV
jgi:RHS repeat-associated protein